MKTIRYLLLFYLAFNLSFLKGAIGCMDKSKHMKERFDTKNYELVQCNCPCNRNLIDGRICPLCRHTHIPSRWEMVHNAAPKTAAKIALADYFTNPSTVMKQLLARYKRGR
ncbi:MAG: hypothetical protein Q8Q25_03315 [bacterium]|nr:hypothetical protein [bacterium]